MKFWGKLLLPVSIVALLSAETSLWQHEKLKVLMGLDKEQN